MGEDNQAGRQQQDSGGERAIAQLSFAGLAQVAKRHAHPSGGPLCQRFPLPPVASGRDNSAHPGNDGNLYCECVVVPRTANYFGARAMLRTGHYLFGLLMFGLAFAVTMGLASFLQQTALTRQQAAVPAQIELPVVSMPSGSYYRKASF